MDARSHEEKVAAVAAQIRGLAGRQRGSDRQGGGGATRIAKGSVSHFVPDPHDRGASRPRIDIGSLDRLLELDVEQGIAVAEPGLTFGELVKETLPRGWLPTVVPELVGITLGGAVSGCSIESMSYRYGGFHDSCLAYEVVTGTGDVIECSPDERPDIFHMMHGSYGTIGVLTRLTFRLVRARPFVRMDYVHFDDMEEFHGFIEQRTTRGDHDFVDAIVHGPRHLVACLGTMVDEAPSVSRYDWRAVYYKSTVRRKVDHLTTFDYLFRYDTECHWITKSVPPLEWPPVRALVGRWFLGSTNLIRWSERLRPLFKLQRRPDVVVDVFVPHLRFEEFFRWYEGTFDFWPLWIVPYRLPEVPYPWVTDDRGQRLGGPGALLFDCAVYGKPNGHRDVDLSAELERFVHDLGGIKTLISRNHYDRDSFWSVYDQPRWTAVKEKTDPRWLFGDLYEKMVEARR